MKIRTGDTVVIISGKDKGKQGTVLRVFPAKNRVIVEGANMRIRHIKKTPQQAGQRISYEASLHASNVMVIDPKTKKPTRIGFRTDAKGRKIRIAKKSGEEIKGAAVTKKAKTPKKTTTTATAAGETPAKSEGKKNAVVPTKQPFWKRGSKTEGGGEGAAADKPSDAKAMPSAHRSQGG